MSIIERAWYYITRKRGKTFVMFCILFIMATAIICGISIKKAAQASMQQARESVGGDFTVGINYGEDNPNIKQEEVESNLDGQAITSIQLRNDGPPLTKQLADMISTVEGIHNHNGSKMIYLDNHGLSPIEAKQSQGHMAVSMDGGETASLSANVILQSQGVDFFQRGELKLLEGRHITEEDSYKVLIHKELAEKNNLALHDTISLLASASSRKEYGVDTAVEVEIIGIYDTVSTSNENALFALMMPQNQFYTDMETGKKICDEAELEFDSLTFGIKDPKQMQKIIDKVKELDIDWKQFRIDAHDMEYQQIAGSIERLDALLTTILYAICIVACIILSLILSLWIKGRIHETGILLSLGISKQSILLQYTVELFMIAILAFSLSFLSGKAASRSISDTLVRQMKAQEEQRMQSSGMLSAVSIGSSNMEEIQALDVRVEGVEMLSVYGIGSCLIIVAVLVSSLSILRLKPKEILSKMS